MDGYCVIKDSTVYGSPLYSSATSYICWESATSRSVTYSEIMDLLEIEVKIRIWNCTLFSVVTIFYFDLTTWLDQYAIKVPGALALYL